METALSSAITCTQVAGVDAARLLFSAKFFSSLGNSNDTFVQASDAEPLNEKSTGPSACWPCAIPRMIRTFSIESDPDTTPQAALCHWAAWGTVDGVPVSGTNRMAGFDPSAALSVMCLRSITTGASS